MKAAYGTAVPFGSSTSPMNQPSPSPIASRKNTGSKNPDSTITQLVLLVALRLRATTARALRA